MTANESIPAGSAAATAAGEYQAKNTRSVKIMIVHDTVDAISGRAIESISRTLPGAGDWGSGEFRGISIVQG